MSLAAAQKKLQLKANTVSRGTVRRGCASDHTTPVDVSILQRKPACACGGGCPQCQANSPSIESKLVISEPGDPFEREADRVADQVMRMPESRVQRQLVEEVGEEKIVQTKSLERSITTLIQRQVSEDEEDEGLIQKKTTGDFAPTISPTITSDIQSLQGGGQPLTNSARSFFEPRIRADFSNVRVHNGARAARAAKSVNARAFTLGHDVVFGAGEYSPDSYTGKKLLAHELTHTIQQSSVVNKLYRTPQQLPAGQGASSSSGTVTTVVSTSSGPMPRVEFEQRMLAKFGVNRFRTGTHTEQNTRVGATIPVSQWQSWDPGSSSEVYRFIFDAFDDFAWAFGGVPNVNEIVFFRTYFENQNGTATANSDVGASYGAGQLTIYNNTSSSARMGLPHERSVAGGTYPGAPILTIAGTGASPGAPVGYPDLKTAVKRVIWHELGHGLAEAASNQCGTSAAPDPSMLRDYMSAVGWHNGHLYDIGNAAVVAALAAGSTPAAGTEITTNDWNHPKWSEQPISAYMVSAPGEDFAEAVRAFVENPNLLLARSPARYRFVSTRVTALGRCLRQVQRPGDYPIPVDDGTRLA